MSSFTDYLENELLDHVFRNAAFTSPSAVYAALFTVNPSDAGGGTEVETNGGPGRGYARQAITFGAPSAGAISNTAAVTFGPNTTTNWGTITGMAIFDAATTGNMLAWADIADKAVAVNDSAEFAIGDIDVTLD